MHTPVEIHFSEACWRFLHDDMMAPPLSAELRAALDLSPRVRIVPADPSPRYIVNMLRLHAYDLLTFVGSALEALPANDARRRDCGRCLDDLDEAIKRSPET
jgi:hypothetical protein